MSPRLTNLKWAGEKDSPPSDEPSSPTDTVSSKRLSGISFIGSPKEKVMTPKRASIIIDKQIKLESKQKSIMSDARVLILGPSDAGKSTILRQMTLSFGKGIPEDEIVKYRTAIYETLIAIMQLLILTYKHEYGAVINSREYEMSAQFLQNFDGDLENEPLSDDVRDSILEVWANEDIGTIGLEKWSSIIFPDSAGYFLEHLNRIVDKNYIPTNEGNLSLTI